MNALLLTAPERLNTNITLPASKSISNRALIITALCEGAPLPGNLSDCDDTRVTINALRDMPDVIDIGAAGTAMRFTSALLCTTEGTHTITGTERMRHRPIGILVDALRQLGAKVEYAGEDGFPPLRITGHKLLGGWLTLRGNVSSQYISALLMIGPAMKRGLRLRLTGNIVSRPYIDMTLSIMNEYGADAEWDGEEEIVVAARPYRPVPYSVENDWSAASYWYEMVALSGDAGATVTLPGLRERSTQGDSRVRDFFARLGVRTETLQDGVRLTKGGERVEHLELDMTQQPDLAQTMAATCCAMGVTFRLTGVQSLRIKETDRIRALQTELGKLGYVVRDEEGRTLTWDGTRKGPAKDVAIDTYDDHRMAMAMAPLAMRHGALRVNDPGVVSKSYPAFWEDLRKAGFGVEDLEA